MAGLSYTYKYNMTYDTNIITITVVHGVLVEIWVKGWLRKLLSKQGYKISWERLQFNLEGLNHNTTSSLDWYKELSGVASSSLWLANVTNSLSVIGGGSSGRKLKIVCFRSIIRPLPDCQLFLILTLTALTVWRKLLSLNILMFSSALIKESW